MSESESALYVLVNKDKKTLNPRGENNYNYCKAILIELKPTA